MSTGRLLLIGAFLLGMSLVGADWGPHAAWAENAMNSVETESHGELGSAMAAQSPALNSSLEAFVKQ